MNWQDSVMSLLESHIYALQLPETEERLFRDALARLSGSIKTLDINDWGSKRALEDPNYVWLLLLKASPSLLLDSVRSRSAYRSLELIEVSFHLKDHSEGRLLFEPVGRDRQSPNLTEKVPEDGTYRVWRRNG